MTRENLQSGMGQIFRDLAIEEAQKQGVSPEK
jgi:hypothetical protein